MNQPRPGRALSRTAGVLCLMLAALSGCSSDRQSAREDLKSSLRITKSLSSESVLFLDHAVQGRAGEDFTASHLLYLVDSIDQAEKDLDKNTLADSDMRNQCRQELRDLRGELLAGREALASKRSLAEIREKIGQIRRDVTHMESRL